MKHLIYYQAISHKTSRIKAAIFAGCKGTSLYQCHTLQELYLNLLPGDKTFDIITVMSSNQQELAALREFGNLIFTPELILLLPDLRKDTLSLGYKLRPTLLFSQNEEMQYITELVAHLVKRIKSHN